MTDAPPLPSINRSLCLVVSPYTRRGAVVSRFHNQTSVLRTMERILGLPSMNQFDAVAPSSTRCGHGHGERSFARARPGGQARCDLRADQVGQSKFVSGSFTLTSCFSLWLNE